MSATIQNILQRCESGYIETADFLAACGTADISPIQVADAVALEAAKRFMSGNLSFSNASAALNALYHLLLECAPHALQAQAIYDAFDAGEAAGMDEAVTRKKLDELWAGV